MRKDEVWINPLYKNKEGGISLVFLKGERDSGRRNYLITKMKKKMLSYFEELNDADKKIIYHNFEAITTGFSVDILEYFIKNDFEKALEDSVKNLKNERNKELYEKYLEKEVITFKEYNSAVKELELCQ